MCKKKNKQLIRAIGKSNAMCTDVKRYHLILGIEPYSGKRRESTQIVLQNDIGLYAHSDGKVAFVPKGKTYPASYLAICKLLFDSVDIVSQIYQETDNTHLVRYLHNKGYILINLSDIKVNNIAVLIENCQDIYICGAQNRKSKYQTKIDEIVQYADKYKKPYSYIYHPSANNIDKTVFREEYINHKGDLMKLIISE